MYRQSIVILLRILGKNTVTLTSGLSILPGHVYSRIYGPSSRNVLEWRPRFGNRSAGCTTAQWTDGLKKMAGSRWTA